MSAKQEDNGYHFYSLWFDQPGIEAMTYQSQGRDSFTRPLRWFLHNH